MPYLQQFACFDCRKVFKYETEFSGWRVKHPAKTARKIADVICPDCGAAMWLMGRKFKAPKRNNIKQWRKAEKIRKAGFNRFPKHVWQADSAIEQMGVRGLSAGEKLLKKIEGSETI